MSVPGDGFEAIVALLSGGKCFSSQATVDEDNGEFKKAHVELDNETNREKPVVEKEEGEEHGDGESGYGVLIGLSLLELFWQALILPLSIFSLS